MLFASLNRIVDDVDDIEKEMKTCAKHILRKLCFECIVNYCGKQSAVEWILIKFLHDIGIDLWWIRTTPNNCCNFIKMIRIHK